MGRHFLCSAQIGEHAHEGIRSVRPVMTSMIQPTTELDGERTQSRK